MKAQEKKLTERRLNMGAEILEFIHENWFLIVIAVALIAYMIDELARYNNEEKVNLAKRLIAVSIDAIVSEAEWKFEDYEKAGYLKRSYVIQTIYEKYPELNKVAEQEELIDWITNLIEDSVAKLKSNISEIE